MFHFEGLESHIHVHIRCDYTRLYTDTCIYIYIYIYIYTYIIYAYTHLLIHNHVRNHSESSICSQDMYACMNSTRQVLEDNVYHAACGTPALRSIRKLGIRKPRMY